jgi:hypothetical protein
LPSLHNLDAVDGKQIAYHERLPADMQRAAPETYRSIRSERVASVRQWILDQFPVNSRQSADFTHLHQSACQADFLLAAAGSEEELNLLLATSDQLEIIFRDLGSFVYERRTGDRAGAAHMRALRTEDAGDDERHPSLLDDSGGLAAFQA